MERLSTFALKFQLRRYAKGAYTVAGPTSGPVDCIFIGTGTELDLAVKAGAAMEAKVGQCRFTRDQSVWN
jgi:transketolase